MKKGEASKAGDIAGRGRGVVARGEVNGQMMMIAVVGEKSERSSVGGEGEAERLVEFLRDVEIGDGEMHVAEAGSRREAGPFFGGACVSGKGGEFFEIERKRGHADVIETGVDGACSAATIVEVNLTETNDGGESFSPVEGRKL